MGFACGVRASQRDVQHVGAAPIRRTLNTFLPRESPHRRPRALSPSSLRCISSLETNTFTDAALRASPAAWYAPFRPMNRATFAIGTGYMSVACSLAFWVWAGLFLFTPLNRSDAWLNLGVGAPLVWLVLWIAGALLGLIACALGSRGWILATILAVASFGGAVLAVSTIHW
jgi:hypothetical protein